LELEVGIVVARRGIAFAVGFALRIVTWSRDPYETVN